MVRADLSANGLDVATVLADGDGGRDDGAEAAEAPERGQGGNGVGYHGWHHSWGPSATRTACPASVTATAVSADLGSQTDVKML